MSHDDLETSSAMHEMRLRGVEKSVERIEGAVVKIAESMEVLTRLEVQHAETRSGLNRAFEAIKVLDTRLDAIDKEIPGLAEVRKWAITGAMGLIGLVMAALVGLVIVKPVAAVDTRPPAIVEAK